MDANPQSNIEPLNTATLKGDDAQRFEHFKLGEEVRLDAQAKIIRKEYYHDEKGEKKLRVELDVNNVFPKDDVEGRLRDKVF
jgi:hypothetical protein